MKNLRIYYFTIISVLILEGLVDFLFNIPIEYHLSFLIPFIFSMYLSHPTIEEYKQKQRFGFSFSRLLFNSQVYLNEKIPDSKYKQRIIMYSPSFVFFCGFSLMQFNLLILAGFALGVLMVELVLGLFNRVLN